MLPHPSSSSTPKHPCNTPISPPSLPYIPRAQYLGPCRSCPGGWQKSGGAENTVADQNNMMEDTHSFLQKKAMHAGIKGSVSADQAIKNKKKAEKALERQKTADKFPEKKRADFGAFEDDAVQDLAAFKLD